MPTPIKVLTKRLVPEAKPPRRNHEGDMGYDFACVADEKFKVESETGRKCLVLPPFELARRCEEDGWVDDPRFPERGQMPSPYAEDRPGTHLFHTGLALAIEEGYGLMLWDRSGMGGKRLVHRFAGVIDEVYRGQLLIRLVNYSGLPRRIYEGDYIAQGVYQQRIDADHQDVGDAELPPTVRGEKGFGSSDEQARVLQLMADMTARRYMGPRLPEVLQLLDGRDPQQAADLIASELDPLPPGQEIDPRSLHGGPAAMFFRLRPKPKA